MFDRRGYGISDRPNGADEVAIEKAMDDMRAVMDVVGSQRAVVYGFEDGAAVSLLFAASYPERTIALVLVTPMVRYFTAADFPWGFSAERGQEWLQRIASEWGTAEFWRWNLETMSGAGDPDEEQGSSVWPDGPGCARACRGARDRTRRAAGGCSRLSSQPSTCPRS